MYVSPENRPRSGFSIMQRHAATCGVTKVMGLTLAQHKTPNELRQHNDYTIWLTEQEPDFFVGAMYLSPQHEKSFIYDEAARCKQAGLVAVKQALEVHASDERVDYVAEVAAELKLPILFHAWYKNVDKFPNESDPADIAALAKRHLATSFIMAHLTGAGRKGIQDIEDCPNVWVDTSGSWYDSEIIEYACKHIGAHRLVYGSDATPRFGGRDFAAQLGRLQGANIADNDKERILWHNAAELFHLKQ